MDLREALHRVLINDGYSVTQATSGRDAIDIASRRESGFDLVVTDVVMPHMNGFELAERFAKTHSESRILLVSGHLNDDALDHMPHEFPFLAKPFAPEELTEKVRQLLDEPV
jgi:two-component system cell cycle sensor histidine kinase/response regulator CckA